VNSWQHERAKQPGKRSRTITACIPYYGCGAIVRRAVEGLLQQTFRDLTVIVVNDADPTPPWNWLRDIGDPRLVRFDLATNGGPYMATAIVLNATDSPYFLIQDADDWSMPDRASRLLRMVEADRSDFAVSGQLHVPASQGPRAATDVTWSSVVTDQASPHRLVLRTRITPEFVYRAPHHGLYRTEALRRLGGYYGGFRVSYDALLTNLILMTGRVSHTPLALYHRSIRPESLTRSADTGLGSLFRNRTEQSIRVIYDRCFQHYQEYQRGRINSRSLIDRLRELVLNNVSPAEADHIAHESMRLRCLLRSIR
jgi:glycosyltransferase involved in cell wall biosynthesis